MPQWRPDSSGIQQGSYKNIHQFPRVEDALIAWVLRSQGRYSTRFSVTRPETPGAGAGAGMMPREAVRSPHLSHPCPVPANLMCFQSYDGNNTNLIKIQCREYSYGELSLKMIIKN